jgi:hypothetical protein
MRSSYLLFNYTIAAMIAAIFFYCGIYNHLGSYAVKCSVEQATGRPCIGCGLTRGMHQAMMLHFDKARQWNESAVLVFTFFLTMLAIRLLLNLVVIKNTSAVWLYYILYSDVVIAILLFLYCYRHFFTGEIFK